jgi:hypothetical protein
MLGSVICPPLLDRMSIQFQFTLRSTATRQSLKTFFSKITKPIEFLKKNLGLMFLVWFPKKFTILAES